MTKNKRRLQKNEFWWETNLTTGELYKRKVSTANIECFADDDDEFVHIDNVTKAKKDIFKRLEFLEKQGIYYSKLRQSIEKHFGTVSGEETQVSESRCYGRYNKGANKKMRRKETVEKKLTRMENKYRAGSCFTPEEEWGIVYALRWVLGYDISKLQNEAGKRASERIKRKWGRQKDDCS